VAKNQIDSLESLLGHPNTSIHLKHTHTHTHSHIQPFYDPLSGTTRVSRYQKRHSPTHTWNVLWESVIILNFVRCGEDNRGRCTDNPAGRHHIRTVDGGPTSIITQILCRMLFLPQPSQFILAWDSHQICWIAYLEAWLGGPFTWSTDWISFDCGCRWVLPSGRNVADQLWAEQRRTARRQGLHDVISGHQWFLWPPTSSAAFTIHPDTGPGNHGRRRFVCFSAQTSWGPNTYKFITLPHIRT